MTLTDHSKTTDENVRTAINGAGEFALAMGTHRDRDMLSDERLDTGFTLHLSAHISMPQGPSLRITTDGERAWADLPDQQDPQEWRPQQISKEQERTCIQYLQTMAGIRA